MKQQGILKKKIDFLRPANFDDGTPGKGFGIYHTKDKKYKVGVMNLMGNVFMRKQMIKLLKIFEKKFY